MKTGMAQRIREAAKRLGTFGVRELADEVGVQSYRVSIHAPAWGATL